MTNFRRRVSPFEQQSSSKKFKYVVYFAIFILFSQFLYNSYWVTPGTNKDNAVTINIPEGSNLKEVAKELKKQNVITSKTLFKMKAKSMGLDTKVQSGIFRVNLPQNLESVLKIVTTPPTENKVTIPEGYKISQIDDLLTEKGLILEGEFIECVQNCQIDHSVLKYISSQNVRNLEGFLFPDTYFISQDSFTSLDLILKMLNNFEAKLPTNYQELASNLPLTDLYSVINMASIIEREVLSQKDKQLVSGILWKRYRSNWSIDADAALLYLKKDNKITTKDLKSESPYNIRRFKGLPPTPISNPSLSSIEAALNPIESDFWFYITTLDTGEVIYAETLDQHNANVNKYLR